MSETRNLLTPAVNYHVYIEVTRKTPITIDFNVKPYAALIDEALRRLKSGISHPYDENEEDAYKMEVERIDNLAAIANLAGDGCGRLRIPSPGQKEIHEVKVAGIYIGKLVIKAVAAWTAVL